MFKGISFFNPSAAKDLLFQPLGSLPAEGPGSEGVRLLRICFFNPSAPFPPKARGRRGFDARATTSSLFSTWKRTS